jgi:hypothetical protein
MECNASIPQYTGVTNTIRHDLNIQEIKKKIIKLPAPVRPHGQPG